jgi:hypothetical protein
MCEYSADRDEEPMTINHEEDLRVHKDRKKRGFVE